MDVYFCLISLKPGMVSLTGLQYKKLRQSSHRNLRSFDQVKINKVKYMDYINNKYSAFIDSVVLIN